MHNFTTISDLSPFLLHLLLHYFKWMSHNFLKINIWSDTENPKSSLERWQFSEWVNWPYRDNKASASSMSLKGFLCEGKEPPLHTGSTANSFCGLVSQRNTHRHRQKVAFNTLVSHLSSFLGGQISIFQMAVWHKLAKQNKGDGTQARLVTPRHPFNQCSGLLWGPTDPPAGRTAGTGQDRHQHHKIKTPEQHNTPVNMEATHTHTHTACHPHVILTRSLS